MTWRGKLLCSTGGFVLIICLLELGARVVRPDWAPTRAERRYWVYDAELGWRHLPGQQGTFSHPDFTVSVSINSHGQRDKEYAWERTPGKKRMLVLGDSFGWGFGVEEEQICLSLIEAKHEDWEIINGSVSGYGTDQELLYLRRDGERYEPDVVLLMLNQTDLHNNHHAVQHWHRKPVFELAGDGIALATPSVAKPSIVQRLDKAFFSHTYLLARVYGSIRSALRRNDAGESATGDTPAESRIELTARLVGAMRDLVEAHDARFIVARASFSDPATALRWDARMEHDGILQVTLDTAFAGVGDEEVLFAHDGHWNARGHALVAEALEKALFQDFLSY